MDPENLSAIVGGRILAARRDLRWSRHQLSEKADVSERYLAQLEKGEANISLALLLRLTKALDVDCRSLFIPIDEPDETGLRLGIPDQRIAALVQSLSPRQSDEVVEILRRYVEGHRRAVNGVALIGLRGAGKTTLGTRLADALDLPFVHLSKLIEGRAGISVKELFNLGGQDAFRRHETETVAQVVDAGEFVIFEAPGGIVENREAYEMVLTHFRTIWLRAAPEEHMDRVINQGDYRPVRGHSAAMTHLRSLLVARERQHARADHELDTSARSVETCFSELFTLVRPLVAMQRLANS